MDMQQVADAVGKKIGIMAVTDGGFAKALAKNADEIPADIDEF